MKVTIAPIDPATPRSAASVNAGLTAIQDASTALDAYNFAEEGLDGRVFATPAVGDRLDYIASTVRTTLSDNTGALFTLMMGATNFRTAAAPLVVLGANDALRITSWITARTTLTTGLGWMDGCDISLFHRWHNGAVAATTPGGRHQASAQLEPIARRRHARIGWESWLVGPGTVQWVELAWSSLTGANAARVANAGLEIVRFKNHKITVL